MVDEASDGDGSGQDASAATDDRLQVPEAPRFESLEWRVTRLGWLLMAAFVAAGLLGFLGPGPFSWHRATSTAGGIEVTYQRVTHHEADDSLTIELAPQAVRDGRVPLELSGDWLTGVDLQGVTPEPAEQRLTGTGVLMEFDVEEPGSSAVIVSFRAQRFGGMHLALAVDGDRVALTQYVLP